MLLLLAALGHAQDRTYEGRPIAPFMSWRGANWLERADRPSDEATNKLLRRMRLAEGDVVVDLGCGTGFHARRIKEKVGAGTVHCVDVQPQMLQRAGEAAAIAGVRLNLVPGRHDAIPLPDDVADHVLLVDVYHELQEPEVMLAELRRVLTPGGVVVVVEFRLEGTTATHIKPEHRMTDEQVIAELTGAGFALLDRYDGLPSQHLLRFRVE